MSRAGAVLHVGPSPRFPGGIASVMVVLAEHSVGDARIVGSWVPGSRRARLRALLAAAAAIVRAPRATVVHVHMAAGGSAVRKGLLLRLARCTGHRAVATVHGSRFEAFAAARPRVAGLALRQAHALFVLSPALLAVAERLAPAVPARRIVNPVEVDGRVTPAGGRAPVVAFAGEVGERKGVDVLLRAWPVVRDAVPSAELVLIGPPGGVAVAPQPGVALIGALPREHVRAQLRAARLVVLPSRAEALPMALLEAMGCGTPFVATPVGDVPRLLAAGAGIEVPVDDADALAAALITVLTDAARASQLGQAGWRAARERYAAAAVSAELTAAYAELRPAAR